MDWSAIGVVAEVVGAAVVVVTLIYLAREVRQNRIAIESTAVDSMADGWNSLNAHIMGDPELAHIWATGFPHPDTLDSIQITRFFFIGQSYLNQFVRLKKYYDEGNLNEEIWHNHASAVSHLFNSPGGRLVCDRAAVPDEILGVFREFGSPKAGKDGHMGIGKYEYDANI